MSITIAIVVYLCLGLHSYLNYFWSKHSLPYSFGFGFFLKIEWLLILLDAIYLLGWLWGIITFITLVIGAGFLTFPISFLCHSLTGHNEMQNMLVGERPAPILYGGWFLLVLILAVLTAVNFFITPFSTGLHLLTPFVESLSTSSLAWISVVFCLIVYLFIGLTKVAKDYSAPLTQRPLYAMQRDIKITVFNIFLWPVSLIARKAMERSLRR